MTAVPDPRDPHAPRADSADERLWGADDLDSPDDQLSALVEGEFVDETTMAAPTGRRAARAVAVQALYESDVTGHPGVPAVERLADEAGLEADLAEFAAALVRRVEVDRASLDARIIEAAQAFPADQMAAVDRNILRVALVELEADAEVPPSVVVNEAVEVAKLFGSESTPRFVNGVLGSVLR